MFHDQTEIEGKGLARGQGDPRGPWELLSLPDARTSLAAQQRSPVQILLSQALSQRLVDERNGEPMSKLTELEWLAVFRVRCKSKQGQTLSIADHALIDRAFVEDRKRYAAMDADVFDATVPVGSTAKARR